MRKILIDVRRANPRDGRWEAKPNAYRVYFWKLMDPEAAATGGPTVWGADEYELHGAADIRDVIAWADEHAEGRRFTLYVSVDHGGERGLLHIAGDDPTESSDGATVDT